VYITWKSGYIIFHLTYSQRICIWENRRVASFRVYLIAPFGLDLGCANRGGIAAVLPSFPLTQQIRILGKLQISVLLQEVYGTFRSG
jgi:hypothetical protein